MRVVGQGLWREIALISFCTLGVIRITAVRSNPCKTRCAVKEECFAKARRKRSQKFATAD